jgi:hypothetical protein
MTAGTKHNAHVALGRIRLKVRKGPVTDARLKARIRFVAGLMGVPVNERVGT